MDPDQTARLIWSILLAIHIIEVQSNPFITSGSIGMDHVISELCYKGQFY